MIVEGRAFWTALRSIARSDLLARTVLACLCLPIPAAAHATLRDIAQACGRRVGAAVQYDYLYNHTLAFGETPYRETLAREYNQISPENEMKWGILRPSPSAYNFLKADVIVAFAEATRMDVRGHTLVWNQFNPCWLTAGEFQPAELASLLEDHIRTVVGRYRNRVRVWDVANEVYNEEGLPNHSIWYDSPGMGLDHIGYVNQAFKWAHEADPNADLFYNDFGLEKPGPKSDAVYKLVQALQRDGTRIDGVGFQMHVDALHPPSQSQLTSQIKLFTDPPPQGLGIMVEVTELDARIPLPTDASKRNKQAVAYKQTAAACFATAKCRAVQTWGFTDKYSWIPTFFRGYGDALPFNLNFAPKESYEALASSLCDGERPASTPTRSPTPAPIRITSLDDFENQSTCACVEAPNDRCPCNKSSGEWQARPAVDHNAIPLQLTFGPGSQSTRAIRIDGPFDDYGQLQTFLAADRSAGHLAGYDAIQFDVRGDDRWEYNRPYWFQLATVTGVNVGDHFGQPFWAGPNWTRVTVQFKDLQQRGFPSCSDNPSQSCSTNKDCRGAACGPLAGAFSVDKVFALQWINLTKDPPTEVHFSIDNVRLVQFSSVDPPEPIRSGPSPQTECPLLFPVTDADPRTAAITGVFDHSMYSRTRDVNGRRIRKPNCSYVGDCDGVVVAFSGERAERNNGALLDCFKQSSGQPFLRGLANYNGAGECGGRTYLSYDGHPGIDYKFGSMTTYGKPVRAAVAGFVSYCDRTVDGIRNSQAHHTLTIDPRNGSPKIHYLHLSSYVHTSDGICAGKKVMVKRSGRFNAIPVECPECAKEGEWVDPSRPDPIGYVGDYSQGWGGVAAHLHFEVDRSLTLAGKETRVAVDPYGWQPECACSLQCPQGCDPYREQRNRCLWKAGCPLAPLPVAEGPSEPWVGSASTPIVSPKVAEQHAAAASPGGDCCIGRDDPGCADSACMECVCGLDPLCCEAAWDKFCVSDVNLSCSSICFCPEQSPVPTPTPVSTPGGDCCSAHGGGGCDNLSCRECVCALDSICCESAWDDLCVSMAGTVCPMCTCTGATPSPSPTVPVSVPTVTPGGDCCAEHGGPGCDEELCMSCICEADSFCCGVSWDVACVDEASRECTAGCRCASASPAATPTVPTTPISPPTATPTPIAFLGDANCDGGVSAADITALVYLIAGGTRAPCGRDDLDGDGFVDRKDLGGVIDSVFGSR